MAKALRHLGKSSRPPSSPASAELDRVANPHADTNYVARFTAPEFTTLCPITGQPDFAHLVIDYVPGRWLVESKSFKLYLGQRATSAASTRTARSPSAKSWRHCSIRNSCASGAICTPRRHADRRVLADRQAAGGRMVARPGCRALSRARLKEALPGRMTSSQNSAQFCDHGRRDPATTARSALTSWPGSLARMTPPITARPVGPAASTSAARVTFSPPIARTGTGATRAISAKPLRPSRARSPVCSASRKRGRQWHSRRHRGRSLGLGHGVERDADEAFRPQQRTAGGRVGTRRQVNAIAAARLGQRGGTVERQACTRAAAPSAIASKRARFDLPLKGPFLAR